jgi:VCBS repeat-containing protein
MTTYTYTTINVPGALDYSPLNINDSGQIVVGYTTGSFWYSSLYSGGTYTPIYDQSFNDQAQGINDSGQIVGYYYPAQGFLYSGGTYTPISVPGYAHTVPLGINDSGEIVGYYFPYYGGPSHGFLDSGGTFTSFDVPGSTVTYPQSINNSEQIVGYYYDGSTYHGFLDSGGTFTTIDVPGSTQTFVQDINDSGQIVGTYYDGSTYHGFLDSGGTFTTIDVPASTQTFISGNNDSGEIVGYYQDSNGRHAFLADPVIPPTVVADRTGVQVGASTPADAAHNVLANDTDPVAGDTLHVSAVNGQPVNHTIVVAGSYGSLTLNADGSYTYAAPSSEVLPASGVGQDVFTYTASTGQGGTADSTLTVNVTAAGLNYIGGAPGTTITSPSGHSPVLDGGAGNNTLIATNGAAVLIGGPGDTLTGGKGTDTYVFLGHFGQNTITNYSANKDIIELDHSQFKDLGAVQHASQQVGANTVISDNAGDTVTLIGVSLNQLHFDANHFLLA